MIAWHPDNSRLDLLAFNALNGKPMGNPNCCKMAEIHIYADVGHWRRKNLASAWIWCSHCGAFDHLDGLLVSEKWVNCPEIELEDLTTPPKKLEEKKMIIDKHYSEYLKASS